MNVHMYHSFRMYKVCKNGITCMYFTLQGT